MKGKTSCLLERMCFLHRRSPQSFLCFLWTFYYLFFFVSPRKLCCTVNCVRREGIAQFEGGEVHSRPHIIWYKMLWPNCLMAQTRLLCAAFLATLGSVVFIKMKKLGFFSPSWTNARAAGRAISLCYKNECKHNRVFLGGIVENSSWNLWRVSSLRELVLSCRASCHIRATLACCIHIFASSGAGTAFYECQKSRH